MGFVGLVKRKVKGGIGPKRDKPKVLKLPVLLSVSRCAGCDGIASQTSPFCYPFLFNQSCKHDDDTGQQSGLGEMDNPRSF